MRKIEKKEVVEIVKEFQIPGSKIIVEKGDKIQVLNESSPLYLSLYRVLDDFHEEFGSYESTEGVGIALTEFAKAIIHAIQVDTDPINPNYKIFFDALDKYKYTDQ